MTASLSQLVAQATQAFSNGDPGTASELSQQALRIERANPHALYIHALARRGLGDPAGALKSLKTVLKMVKNSAEVMNVVGLCEQDLGHESAARKAFEAAERFDPSFVHAPFNLARLLFDLGEREGAVAAYERTLALQKDYAPALSGLAHTHQNLRNYAEAERYADLTLALRPNDAIAVGVKGAALLREGKADEAVTFIRSRLNPNDGGPMNVAMALGTLGEAYEALGEYKHAFDAWHFANERIRAQYEAYYEAHEGPYSLAVPQRMRDYFAGLENQVYETTDTIPSPVFLVGFPRSGTTLLENVLAAHPAIETSGELPHAEGIVEATGSTGASIARLMGSGEKRLRSLRNDYWRRAKPDGAPQDGALYIDKLPLNLIWMGILARVFPNAKFILALRDPRDCVLSAFQQRFVMNPAMYRMLRMDDAARYYDAAFSAAEAARRAIPGLNVLEVRYEDVVADLEGEARRTIAFLGLDWDESVMTYRDQARTRAINTPSGPQVIQPVYSKSLDRWRNYDFAFEGGVAEMLAPWIERWGYSSPS